MRATTTRKMERLPPGMKKERIESIGACGGESRGGRGDLPRSRRDAIPRPEVEGNEERERIEAGEGRGRVQERKEKLKGQPQRPS